jgi:hypothetical protein
MLGDTGREWHINLSDGGKLYTIADGCLAKIAIKRPTETRLEEFCTIEGNTTIVYDFSQNQNTAAVEGIHDCEVTLYGLDGKVITTARFTMVVSERAVSGDDIIIYDEDYTAMDAMLTKEAERQAAETQRADAETKRVSEFAKLKEQIKSAFIRYSANADGTDFTEQWSNGQNYIGFATGQTAPTDKSKYTWILLPQGESAFIRYSSHNDGRDFTEEWSAGQCYIGVATGHIAPTDKSEYTWALLCEDVRTYQAMFANSLVGKAQGAVVSMDDVASDGIAIVNLRSKNLIPYPYYSSATTSLNGVTITINEDNSITFEGTATDKIYYFLASGSSGKFKLPFGDYTFSNSIIGTGVGLHLETYKNGVYQQGMGIGSDVQVRTINLSKEYNTLVISAVIESGKTVDCTIYPQLEKGTVATPYTPYVADDTAVTVKSCGKNLFGCYGSSIHPVHPEYTVVTVDGSRVSVYIPNSLEYWFGYDTMRPYTTQYLPAGTYRLSWHNLKISPIEGYAVLVGTYSLDSDDTETLLSEMNVKHATGYTFTLSKASKIYTSIYFINNTVENLNAEFDLMLTPVSSDVEFEPYIEGETIEVTMGSDNINVLSPIAPNMTIQPDNSGVILAVDYKRDTNIAYERLEKRLAELETAIVNG